MATVRLSPDKADHANVLDYDREAAHYDGCRWLTAPRKALRKG